jgi:hypothetical protein
MVFDYTMDFHGFRLKLSCDKIESSRTPFLEDKEAPTWCPVSHALPSGRIKTIRNTCSICNFPFANPSCRMKYILLSRINEVLKPTRA